MQSDKSLAIASTGIANRVSGANRPTVIIVHDLVDNVQSVQEKANAIMRKFNVSTKYVGSRHDFANVFDDHLDEFLRGEIIPLMTCNDYQLQIFRNYCIRGNVSDMVLILDECDTVFTKWLAPNTCGVDQLTSRERLLYELLGWSGRGSGWVLNRSTDEPHLRSRVRSLVQVSATHMNTFAWSQMWRTPFKAFAVDLEVIKERGYSVYADIQPFRGTDGQPVFLRADLSAAEKMRTPQFQAFMQAFRDDDRAYRLMLAVMTSTKNAGSQRSPNMAIVGQQMLRQCPNAHVLVSTADGVTMITRGTGDVVIGKGSVMKDDEGKPHKLVKVLNMIDDLEHGTRPVIIIGYQCVGRCVSIRGRNYAITHMLISPPKSMNTASLSQAGMRGAGKTTSLRRAHGFQEITALMDRGDLRTLHGLYSMMCEVLLAAGTGRMEDLDACFERQYPREYQPVLDAMRKHMPPKMEEERVTKRIRLEPPPPAPAPLGPAAATVNFADIPYRYLQLLVIICDEIADRDGRFTYEGVMQHVRSSSMVDVNHSLIATLLERGFIMHAVEGQRGRYVVTPAGRLQRASIHVAAP